MEDVDSRQSQLKTINQFFCHQMVYTLCGGNYHCVSCTRIRSKYPGFVMNSVKITRHFISRMPRHTTRTCHICKHPLLFICRAKWCKSCCNYFNDNAELMEYEDGIAEITSTLT